MDMPRAVLAVFGLALIILAPMRDLPAQEKGGNVQPASSGAAATAPVTSKDTAGLEKPGPSKRPPDKKDAKSEKPGDKSKEADDKKKKPDEKEKPKEAPKTKKRPTEPLEPPDPKELALRPDKDGKLKFNFKGQPWPDVLQWLADVSGLSLDWQETPADYLNLVTQRGYTVEEARDLINRHLLARGFTLLRNGEILSVARIDKLDPGMVPRVNPEQLEGRDPHEIVKVSFKLDWLLAEKAVEEFKPMLSPHGKLTALTTTNRLEAIDTVVNLRQIYEVLTEEQSADGQERLVREFKLQHVRAADVIEQLKTLLGVESKAPAMPVSPEQQAQQAQMAQMQAQQMEQMGRQRGEKGGAAPKSKPGEIHLVANSRNNSILAHAPPDKMAVIAQAVMAIDVPSDAANSLLRNMARMQIYRLAAIDPEPLVKVLEELGDLDPVTHLKIDKKNRAIIAYASLADHVTIRSLVEKLDGTNRHLEVIPLHRLEADYVAGTIRFMMGGEEPEKRSGRDPYYYYRYGGGGRQEEESDKFRVDAEVEYNRLLLWANDIELKEVENLLVKLGEIPAKGGNPNTVRVIDVSPGKETDEWLERIQHLWPSVGPNKLLVDPPAQPEKQPRDTAPEDKPGPSITPSQTTTTQSSPGVTPGSGPRISSSVTGGGSENRLVTVQAGLSDSRLDRLSPQTDSSLSQTPQTDSSLSRTLEDSHAIALQAGDAEQRVQPGNDRPHPDAGPRQPAGKRQPEKNADPSPPPIHVTRSPDGRLIISSEDTRALDLLEEMMARSAPPRKDYKVFPLQYADAYWVKMNLEEYFEDDSKKDDRRSNFYSYYWGGYPSDNSKEPTRRLSKRRPLKFIYDSDTNTILVLGGDAQQLKTVAELIELYDQPEATDSKSLRKSQVFKVQYGKAKVIGDTVKDVYRDLLSANDKALMEGQQQKRENRFTYITSFGDEGAQKIPRFKGALSIGVDELSNTLVVSAQPYLLTEIGTLIEDLDELAKPVTPSIRVMSVRHLNSPEIEALSKALGQASSAGKPTAKPGAQRPKQATPKQSSGR